MQRLLRSFALRTALGIAGAALLVSLAGAWWGWSRAERALQGELDLILATEAEGLVRDEQTLGPGALLDAANFSARRQTLILVQVQTPDGRTLAGRVPGAPAALQGFATLVPADGSGPIRALGALLPGGLNLVVGVRASAAQNAARALTGTPLVAALGATLAALLLGFVGARALERRLAHVSDAARLLAAGDLSSRLPRSGRGDEFDRLADTVNGMLARLETLVATQRQVTDDIAHDLRSPLGRLRVRLEDAAQTSPDPAPLHDAIAELDGVLQTFSDLLRIARVEAGTVALGPVDLSALVRAVGEAYAPVAEEAGRAFTLEVPSGVQIRGDPALLQRMLANLLDNALAHGAGKVGVALAPGPVLSVTDEGPGVPEGERDAVFRRFVRLDRSRETPGTGLGLSLVAAAAAAHGGRVTLEPARTDGTGLRVTVNLSAARL